MKRILNLTIVTIVLLACTSFSGAAYASENYSPAVKVWVENNDIQFDAKPFIDENDRTLIPVRFVSEALGAEVTWDQDNEEVTIKDNDTIINLSIGSNDIFINGEVEKMDTKAIIKEDRTFVPLRFVSEALDCNVTWDQEFYIAKINRDTEVEETEIATV
ncbi:MAG: copper amine oxidase N-terminal domain-containing protein, partial [Bacillota bacterium]|nr:copper amine oxidase N-terminal domain-containing protein [Bacillota bacterium]